MPVTQFGGVHIRLPGCVDGAQDFTDQGGARARAGAQDIFKGQPIHRQAQVAALAQVHAAAQVSRPYQAGARGRLALGAG